MKRRGFNPWHLDHLQTPPHPEYDQTIARLGAVGALNGCIYGLCGNRGTGKTQISTRLCAEYLASALDRQAKSQAERYAIIARAGEKGRTCTDAEWAQVKALQINLMPEERWPLYTSAKDLFRAIKESWETSTESEVVNRFLKADILVIDEAHVRTESKWEDDHLSDLIDRRCYRDRDTLILSNLALDAFAQALGPSIVSRVHERGEFIECNWASFRESA